MSLKLTRKGLYEICLITWIIVSVFFGRTTIDAVIGSTAITIYSLGRILIYVFLFCAILWGGISRKETIEITLLSITLVLSAVNSGEVVLLGVLLFVAAAKEIKADNIMLIYFKIHLFILIVTTILAFTNVIDMNVMSRGMIQRNSFGFSHPNGFGGEILTIIVCYVTLKWKKIKNIELMMITILGLVLLQEADCRMASIVLGAYVLCIWMIKNIYKFKVNVNAVKNIVMLIFFMILAVTIYAVVWYSYQNKTLRLVDSILSYRFDAMHSIYKSQGIRLFGQKILNEAAIRVDNSYARVMLINGFIPFVILALFSVNTCKVFAQKDEVKYLLAFGAIMLSGFIENNFFRIENNFCILIGGTYLLSSISKEKLRNGLSHDKDINRTRIQ